MELGSLGIDRSLDVCRCPARLRRWCIEYSKSFRIPLANGSELHLVLDQFLLQVLEQVGGHRGRRFEPQ
eukprot:16432092-Heterocapsa_arctica.AAC.2